MLGYHEYTNNKKKLYQHYLSSVDGKLNSHVVDLSIITHSHVLFCLLLLFVFYFILCCVVLKVNEFKLQDYHRFLNGYNLIH